jgi:cell division septation protein DedD
LASQIPDDGFHEIQLNGKQLVFLFMAATVVSVVIFLCGVLVGRGVRAERVAQSADTTTAAIEPTPQVAPPAATPAGSDPTTVTTPPPTVDDLSYFNRLEKTSQPAEELKSTAAKPPASGQIARADVAVKETPKPAPAAKEAPQEAAPPAPAVSDGYVIQVAAMPEHGVADAMAKRLSAKGYTAFVMTADGAKPTMYRVRIGRFKTKREAETIATRLQKEEQFKPWITR